jgi:GntR family transcriptional repressor for pyruvate dehydrogenase complex
MATPLRFPMFKPPARRRIHEDVAAQLRDAILDGRYRAGSKLPPERELAEEFRVNRTSVREAIKVLEGLGLISVRQGDGATVQPLADASLDVLAPMIFHGGRVDVALLEEMGEVIGLLMYEMARVAIERVQPEQLDELRRLRDRMADASLPAEDRFGAGRDLLVVLSDITRNRVWQMLARRVRAFLASEPLRETRRRLRRDPAHIVPVIDACMRAIDAGRRVDAIAQLREALSLLGDTTHAGASRTISTKRQRA